MNSTHERPILFSGPMVHAILNGSKTMTRRIVKPQPSIEGQVPHLARCPYGVPGDGARFGERPPPGDGFYFVTWEPGDEEQRVYLRRGKREDAYDREVDLWTWGRDERDDPEAVTLDVADPLAIRWRAPGDRLWVRETFYCDHAFAGDYSDPGHVGEPSSREQQEAEWRDAVYYRADGEPDFEAPDGPTPWKPSIHMPRWASRIDLEVTAVRVERLQDITEEDALAEGLRPLREQGLRTIGQPGWQWGDGQGEGARDAFSVLWDDINGKKAPWAANPWVWVVSFKRVRPA